MDQLYIVTLVWGKLLTEEYDIQAWIPCESERERW